MHQAFHPSGPSTPARGSVGRRGAGRWKGDRRARAPPGPDLLLQTIPGTAGRARLLRLEANRAPGVEWPPDSAVRLPPAGRG